MATPLLKKLRSLRRPKQMDLEEYLARQLARGYSKDGRFIPDPTPLAPPVGYVKAPSLAETIRDMVRSERLAQAAREAGAETFEESEDFDVGDEPEQMPSPWENDHDPPLEELLKAGRESLAQKQAAAGAIPRPSESPTGDADASRPSNPPTDGPGSQRGPEGR